MGPKNRKSDVFCTVQEAEPAADKTGPCAGAPPLSYESARQRVRLRSRAYQKAAIRSPTGTEAALNRGSTPLYHSFRQITAPAVPG